MNIGYTLKDKLTDLARASVEAREEAFSSRKDADDAEMLLEGLLEELVHETIWEIKHDFSRILGDD